MFCPSCGSEERQPNQFCRACGTDLRNVRFVLERPDKITASAASARDQIGQAIAEKIRELGSARDLKRVAEDVLPQIEKFLESPEQRRLRRFRAGVIVSSVGVGITLMSILASLAEKDILFVAGAGIIVFFVGLAFLINGLLFTIPSKSIPDNSLKARKQRELEQPPNVFENNSNEFFKPDGAEPLPLFSSVTEHTTHQLADQQK